MQTRTIIITSNDRDRLLQLIAGNREQLAQGYQAEGAAYLKALEQELAQAEIVEPQDVPADVVTMNSTVVVKMEGQKRGRRWTIVYPDEADIDENRISVLAPLGTALLGYRVGDTVEWEVPAGRKKFLIDKIVKQPEAQGNYEL